MAYAIIQAGGKQFRVTEGQVVRVPSLTAKIGSSVEFDVLVTSNGDSIEVGAPTVDGSRVTAVVVEHGRGTKIIVFKKKRRKQYKKTHGHRQNFTAVRIESIGAEPKKREKAEAEETEPVTATREATAPETEPAAAPEAAKTEAAETDAAETDAAETDTAEADAAETAVTEPTEPTGEAKQ